MCSSTKILWAVELSVSDWHTTFIGHINSRQSIFKLLDIQLTPAISKKNIIVNTNKFNIKCKNLGAEFTTLLLHETTITRSMGFHYTQTIQNCTQ